MVSLTSDYSLVGSSFPLADLERCKSSLIGDRACRSGDNPLWTGWDSYRGQPIERL